MNSLKLLQNIIKIFYYLSILSWFFILIMLFIAIFSDPVDKFEIIRGFSNEMPVYTKPAIVTFLIYSLIVMLVTVYLLSVLKNLVKSFSEGRIFTKHQIIGLRLIGQLIILLNLTNAVVNFIFRIIFASRFQVKMALSDFWLFIALGLFFIYLSHIFEKARNLKEENDLTV